MMTSFKVVFDFATQTYPGLNWLPQGVITKINEKKDSLRQIFLAPVLFIHIVDILYSQSFQGFSG
jgi:hypothetical protein